VKVRAEGECIVLLASLLALVREVRVGSVDQHLGGAAARKVDVEVHSVFEFHQASG
jgi:hypothetical protein